MRKNANRYAVRIFLDDRRNLHEYGCAIPCTARSRREDQGKKTRNVGALAESMFRGQNAVHGKTGLNPVIFGD